MLPIRAYRHYLLMVALLYALGCNAGNISFGLSLTGDVVTVTLQGDSTAYYPAAFRLLADGRWERLEPLPGQAHPAELNPGEKFEAKWADARPLESLTPFEKMQIGMVRFFDQAGVGFGQISMFHPPATTQKLLKAEYVDGLLSIQPPAYGDGDSASWLLWPQEDGIAPIGSPVRFKHVQPPARRIEWRPGATPLHIDTGSGLPAATLLHETLQGYVMLRIPGGGVQGRQQRSGWLDASIYLYPLALIAVATAVMLLLWHAFATWRGAMRS